MKTEIISVGTELLMGFVVDTNSSKIAQELLSIGIGTYHLQTVGDNPERIRDALELASKRSDIIILSGGLGPTQDDITKEVVAEFVGDELVEDETQLERILTEFKKRGEQPTKKAYSESLTFKHGTTLLNDVGLACGATFELEREGTTPQYFILLPGVPYEMEYMLKNGVKPYLLEKVQQDGVIDSMYLNFYAIGESKVASILDERILSQTNPTIAMYAKPRHVMIRLTANAADPQTAQQMNQQVADEILAKLTSYFIGYGEDQTIESRVIELLQQKKLSLSVVEGFTGGLLMDALTGIAGVSAVFEGGIVSRDHKTSEKQFDLTDLGSQSEEKVVMQLAEQCAEKFQTDVGLGVSASTELDPSGQRLSGTGFVAIARKDEATLMKKIPFQTLPEQVLRGILKNEALAFLKEAVE
ncbi:CinA family nicotinamide mononucleotide deamidase-related protein [Alkalibacterium sp. 20]|uniref:CinA family nicotinamide mononucleotide deamidase-related protein n=1 Tax=Alkalibacterium sp. 20 TaxID=1798803 RepID=UPI0009001165|nr:CinA family nicotinamide mononucleotide deamidase-related protein [Alkalibacterium sp. 20]OJF94736.1 hypothetical protein AX762_07225 [Alkalibacterium sp. 20]